jgi:hypothetical protein
MKQTTFPFVPVRYRILKAMSGVTASLVISLVALGLSGYTTFRNLIYERHSVKAMLLEAEVFYDFARTFFDIALVNDGTTDVTVGRASLELWREGKLVAELRPTWTKEQTPDQSFPILLRPTQTAVRRLQDFSYRWSNELPTLRPGHDMHLRVQFFTRANAHTTSIPLLVVRNNATDYEFLTTGFVELVPGRILPHEGFSHEVEAAEQEQGANK